MDLSEAHSGPGHRHPWELSRRSSLLTVLERPAPAEQLADIGAGDLFFGSYVAASVTTPVLAVDIHYREEGREGNVLKLKTLDHIAPGSIDRLFLLDVLEHVPDPVAFLGEVASKLKSGGKILATVPAFQFLYSQHDVQLKHYRRFNMHDFASVGRLVHGLEVEQKFYFYSLLFVARLLQKIVAKPLKATGPDSFDDAVKGPGISAWRFAETHGVTRFLRWVLDTDFKLNRLLARVGLSSFGLSACIVWRKQ